MNFTIHSYKGLLAECGVGRSWSCSLQQSSHPTCETIWSPQLQNSGTQLEPITTRGALDEGCCSWVREFRAWSSHQSPADSPTKAVGLVPEKVFDINIIYVIFGNKYKYLQAESSFLNSPLKNHSLLVKGAESRDAGAEYFSTTASWRSLREENKSWQCYVSKGLCFNLPKGYSAMQVCISAEKVHHPSPHHLSLSGAGERRWWASQSSSHKVMMRGEEPSACRNSPGSGLQPQVWPRARLTAASRSLEPQRSPLPSLGAPCLLAPSAGTQPQFFPLPGWLGPSASYWLKLKWKFLSHFF